MAQFVCKICNKQVKIPQCNISRYKNGVCSRVCRFELMKIDRSINPNYRGGSNLRCITCKNEFYVKPSHKSRRKTCSKLCANKYKISSGMFAGENNPQWIDGRTQIIRGERHSKEYRHWRKSVLERDKCCVFCGSFSNLHADHIKPFQHNIESRYDINNGRILCFDCHKKTDTYGKKVIKSFS